MLCYKRTRRGLVLPAILFCTFAIAVFGAFAVLGEESSGVLASFTGTLSSPAQEDHIAFEVDANQVELNANGGVDLVFIMSSTNSTATPVDPGLISIAPNGSGSIKKSVRRPDTANSTASILLATLTPGMYEIVVQSEHKTTGPYRLDVLLAGDANGDFKVDSADTTLISTLDGKKKGDAQYSPNADVDRNGVINGGDRQRAVANAGAVFVAPESNPLELSLPAGALALVGASPDTYVNRTGGLHFSLTGAEFDPTVTDVKLTINNVLVPAGSLVIEPHLLTANITLANGRNDVALKAYDAFGRSLYYSATLWAGSANLQVNLVNPDGTAFTQQTNVIASLSDDPTVAAQGVTTTGTITFTNVPARTILVKAKGIGNEIGTAGVIGTQGVVTIKMAGFNPPSPIANNDLSLGAAGWDIAPGSPVSIVPHKEIIPSSLTVASSQSVSSAPTLVDQDIMVGTSGVGERSVSRTFNTSQTMATSTGTTAVKIRYRFITSEVPGGFFGTQFNDYFRVSIRSQNGGGVVSETNSMNGLGLGAFNFATGETQWREATLPVDSAGDVIQADVAVANVGDGAFQSQVVVDFIQEIKDQVRPALAWDNTQGGLKLTWEVLDQALEHDVTINVYFANGAGYTNRLGSPVFSHVVPAGSGPGAGGPIHIPGTDLADDPAGTTHLIAASSESMVGSIQDVRISFGANADATAVSAGMRDVIKDGLRAAGASVGTITSTARSPEDQARAMFNNIRNTGAAAQFALYAPPGDAVIQVYVDETAGMTPAQITANAATIQAAMVDEINAQGPENVSKHCADPAVRSVVDVSYGSFNTTNRTLFINSVTPRLSRLIDEPNNSCLHLELDN